ncbi:MAG: adenylate/guanylate cyclase domain-containing protein [Deltaproteobacteria bacterium]|nr:adenylate/guanylate cyclase domain-containing protein [Deltaproteobacteria bacterium]
MSLISIAKLYRDVQQGGLKSSILLDYLNSVATIQDDRIQKKLLKEVIRGYVVLEKRVDALLKNTLPEMVADEIKDKGRFTPRSYDCSILFVDVVGFTGLAEKVPGPRLIELLNIICRGMDDLVASHRGTKIKTIGDAYMAVFGAPHKYGDHAPMAVQTGLGALQLVDLFNNHYEVKIGVRIGIHSGTVMAGVIGKERKQFDIFGDNVNIASRFESSGEKGRVNVSHETYMRTRDFFEFEERGEIALKNKANMKAYFVVRKR